MDIDELTVKQLKEIDQLLKVDSKDNCWEIGKNYLIRTVTMYDTGRLVKVTEQELVLEDAAWIADTGKFSETIKSLNFNEIEPFPDGKVIIGRGAIIDAIIINSTLRERK